MDRPDAIVIGSGIGGLTAAATLANSGLRPLVLEHHFAPGGNAQTFRRRKMFDFDVGLHYIGGCEPGGAFPTLFERLGVDGIEFLPMDPDGFDTIRLPDLTFRVPAGWDRYGERLREPLPPAPPPPPSRRVAARPGPAPPPGRLFGGPGAGPPPAPRPGGGGRH